MKRSHDASMQLLARQAAAWCVELPQEEMERLARYSGLLSSYERANIIGVRDSGSIIREHLLDSLSCLLFEPLKNAEKLTDVGSGGGLPGIPLKIALPSVQTCLLEATAKKASFLRFAIRELGLRGIWAINARAEEHGGDERRREQYDIATARAVAPLPVIAEYCLPLVKVGGHVVCMKGTPTAEELQQGGLAARLLGAKLSEVLSVPFLPDVGIRDHRLVILEKTRTTPKKYPRAPGRAKKHPLGMPSNET